MYINTAYFFFLKYKVFFYITFIIKKYIVNIKIKRHLDMYIGINYIMNNYVTKQNKKK